MNVNINKICSKIEQKIRDYQSCESKRGELLVDSGNIDYFIKNISDTVIDFINDIEMEAKVNVSEVTIDFEAGYNTLKEENAKLKMKNQDLTQAVVNLALKLK